MVEVVQLLQVFKIKVSSEIYPAKYVTNQLIKNKNKTYFYSYKQLAMGFAAIFYVALVILGSSNSILLHHLIQ
jgi:hypothetical protein